MKFRSTLLPGIAAAACLGLPALPPAAAAPHVHMVAIDPAAESPGAILEKAASLAPAPRQMAFHQLEFTCFIHFGPNTFTGVEWGNGKENPAVFNPGETLDTDQWCRIAKEAGMRLMLVTVKHHDGFCTWQTRYNGRFSVRAIPWRGGRGDVLRELADSCRRHGLKLGVYLSPADLFQIEDPKGLYGNGSAYRPSVIPTDPATFASEPSRPRADRPPGAPLFEVEADDYNRYFMNQLYELLTEYGPVHEVWFDGAHPKRKGGQTYVKDKWFELIRLLAPEAVIFGGPDVRWCGNEAGRTRATEWNILPVHNLAESGKDRPAEDVASAARLTAPAYEVYGEKLQSNFLCYLIPEVNTSIRAGWFWRNESEQAVRDPDDVFDIYERAVGGNGVFLLNVPPDKHGRFGERDAACLAEVGRRVRATYGDNSLMRGASCDAPALLDGDPETFWQAPGDRAEIVLRFPGPRTFNRLVVQEAIERVGQRVAAHAVDAEVDGRWQEVAAATTIGYKRILRFPAVTTGALRLRLLEARARPALAEVSAHFYQAPLPALAIARGAGGRVAIEPRRGAAFGWKAHGQGDGSLRAEIHFTTDGSTPGPASPRYREPFDLPEGGRIKAVALAGGQAGPVAEAWIGIRPDGWKIHRASSEHDAKHAAALAIDGNPATFWHTDWSASPPHPHELVIDLGRAVSVAGFTYLPRQDRAVPDSMVESGEVGVSADGERWSNPQPFEFGNLVNDPSLRTVVFPAPAAPARYFRFVSKTGAAGKPYAGAAEIGILAAPPPP
jgi:alpha-L-fucosidase